MTDIQHLEPTEFKFFKLNFFKLICFFSNPEPIEFEIFRLTAWTARWPIRRVRPRRTCAGSRPTWAPSGSQLRSREAIAPPLLDPKIESIRLSGTIDRRRSHINV